MHTRSFTINAEDKGHLRERLKSILSGRREVVFAYIYGSSLDDVPVHDIDVGVYVSGVLEEAGTGYLLELSSILQKASKVPLDVRILNFAPVSFQYHVLRGDLLFVRDEAAWSLFSEQVVQRYLDIKPLLRRGMKEAFAA